MDKDNLEQCKVSSLFNYFTESLTRNLGYKNF